MRLEETAEEILKNRYYLKDTKTGKPIETWDSICERVSNFAASPEKPDERSIIQKQYFEALRDRYLVPSSPILMNAGTDKGQLCACFVLPIHDTIDSIFDTVKHAALIHKSGGGTGFSFSKLRAKGSQVKFSGGVSSGPVEFMKVFDAATKAIKQGGKRKGANLGCLLVTHPDILDFIRIKSSNKEELINFNISVMFTDVFMENVINNANKAHIVLNPAFSSNEAFLIENNKQVSVGDLFSLFVENAWRIGDPGCLFIDKANATNVLSYIGKYESTNPCGELYLLPHEACMLSAVNLDKMVKNECIDWEKIRNITRLGVRFLDNLIDVNTPPLLAIERKSKLTRRIGLGITGLHDSLIQLEEPYSSERGRALASAIMSFIHETAVEMSEELARVRGKFPLYDGGKCKFPPRRNCELTTIQPSGTMSMLMNCSSGCEPYFYVVYEKHVLDGKKFLMVNKHFERIAKREGFYSDELMKEIANTGTVIHNKKVPIKWQNIFRCAQDIHWKDHIKMQATLQKHGVDGSISKTINMPKTSKTSDVREAILTGYVLGCKGITIYRDGCRHDQPVQLTKSSGSSVSSYDSVDKSRVLSFVPEVSPATKVRQSTPFGNLHVTIVTDTNKKELEIFAHLGRSGELVTADLEAICRLCSCLLRAGVPIEEILRQLKDIGSSLTLPSAQGKVKSLPDGISKAITSYINYKKQSKNSNGLLNSVDKLNKKNNMWNLKCPLCNSILTMQEGCTLCQHCGFSVC
jgi:ribonucleoside-diphosphate reductase alpha chain